MVGWWEHALAASEAAKRKRRLEGMPSASETWGQENGSMPYIDETSDPDYPGIMSQLMAQQRKPVSLPANLNALLPFMSREPNRGGGLFRQIMLDAAEANRPRPVMLPRGPVIPPIPSGYMNGLED